jgi:hypothetical protein
MLDFILQQANTSDKKQWVENGRTAMRKKGINVLDLNSHLNHRDLAL